MKSHVNYRLSAALLPLALLGGSTVRGEETLTDGLVFAPRPCEPTEARCRIGGLAFDFAPPVQCTCGATYSLCGHVCDGEKCYESDDAAEGQTVASELAADAKENLNFRIETCDVAPPMPMLRTKQTAVATAVEAAPARCELGSPAEAVADDAAAPAYGPEMLEVVRLRCELDAVHQQLETQRRHHAEVLALIEQLHESKTLAAEVSASQESRELFCKNWGGLVEQHFKAIAERSVLQSKHDEAARLHESELDGVRLKAELAAAKEWISHRLAAEQSMPAPVVGYPYPMPPMFAPPGMIPAPYAVYEPQFVAGEPQQASPARPWQPLPVPFAFGTYAPQESAAACPACPASSSSQIACSDAACSDAACGSCSDLACTAPSGKVVSEAGETIAAAAGCECKDCGGSDCSCASCVCSDSGVCGCVKVCPSGEAPAAAADANVADRGEQSAESR